jgi:hypothetical protein
MLILPARSQPHRQGINRTGGSPRRWRGLVWDREADVVHDLEALGWTLAERQPPNYHVTVLTLFKPDAEIEPEQWDPSRPTGPVKRLLKRLLAQRLGSSHVAPTGTWPRPRHQMGNGIRRKRSPEVRLRAGVPYDRPGDRSRTGALTGTRLTRRGPQKRGAIRGSVSDPCPSPTTAQLGFVTPTVGAGTPSRSPDNLPTFAHRRPASSQVSTSFGGSAPRRCRASRCGSSPAAPSALPALRFSHQESAPS